MLFDDDGRITILTSLKNGNGGQTAISTFLLSTDIVSSASSVARATAVLKSVFIFQLPATRGVLPPCISMFPLLEKEPWFDDMKAFATERTASTTTKQRADAVMINTCLGSPFDGRPTRPVQCNTLCQLMT